MIVMNKNLIAYLAILSLLTSCSYMPAWMGGRTEEKPKLEGQRLVALPVESKLQIDIALKSMPPKLPAVTANSDWLQHSGVFTANTGNLAGGDWAIKNSAKIGNGNSFSHSLVARPVVLGGIVFAMDSAGVISAHDAVDISKIIWKSTIIADDKEHDVIGGGVAVDGGVLYATTGQGTVGAFEVATGKNLWRKDFGVPMRASPRISAGKIIVVTMDSKTYALSSKTGEIAWEHSGINETAGVMNSVSPTVAGNTLLVPYASGELFALSMENGNPQWNDTLLLNNRTKSSGVFMGIGGDPVVDGNVVFAVNNNGVTVAINAKGERVWQQQAASINTPWLAGDELFMLTADNLVIDMVKTTGKIRWITPLDSFADMEQKLRPISWRGPVLVAGNLVLISSHGEMVFVSTTTGKITAIKEIPNNITTAPVVAGGRLYLVGQNAILYSFSQ